MKVAAQKRREPIRSPLACNRSCSPSDEVNILLMGSSGVGKTTFINAMINYMKNDSLDDAVHEPFESLINSSFIYNDRETFEEKNITSGKPCKYEQCNNDGEAATQCARSFVFPVGKRNLRFIDTPGLGDSRGLEQDQNNFRDVLRFISQYDHLNGICLMFKSKQEKLDILFKFCVNEILRHLHTDARNSIVFILTHSRDTMYTPGSTKRLITLLLDSYKTEHQTDIPFSKINTFLFDNESYRFLALRHHGITLDDDDTHSYRRSWDYSVTEYARFMKYISQLPCHKVQKTICLNEMSDFLRKLPRPLAETSRAIKENIHLADIQKKRIIDNPEVPIENLEQYDAVIVRFSYPRTVCMGANCHEIIERGGERRTQYRSICHDECYLKSVVQETLNDPGLEDCRAMDYDTGICYQCGCHWSNHKHITYDYHSNIKYIPLRATLATKDGSVFSLKIIDKHIENLRYEENAIKEVYRSLTLFIYQNALVPINDSVVDYLKYFLKEAENKKTNDENNKKEIQRLKDLINEYNSVFTSMRAIFEENAHNHDENFTPENMVRKVEELYELPIMGRQFREQLESITLKQHDDYNDREIHIELPAKSSQTKTMKVLHEVMR